MDAELEFAIQPNTTGKQLFDQVTYTCLCVFICTNTSDKAVVVIEAQVDKAEVFPCIDFHHFL